MKNYLLIIIFYFFSISNLFALIKVDITRGNLDPLPIAVSPLHVESEAEKIENIEVKKLGSKISNIIETNFRNTGLFNPLKKKLLFKNLILHI